MDMTQQIRNRKDIEKGKEIAKQFSDALNSFTPDNVVKGFVEGITRNHRTLQQSSMDAIMSVIREWAKMYDEKCFDLRNEATCKLCKSIVDMTERSEEPLGHLPLI